MKVLCIDASGLKDDARRMLGKRFTLVENEVYEPISEEVSNGRDIYLLYEDIDAQLWYDKRRFIPLSEIDGTELVKEKAELA